MGRGLALVVAALVNSSTALAQDTWSVDKVHSEVTFQVRHFVTKVRGRFTDFAGTIVANAVKPEASSVEFTIKAASIGTDNEYRDKDRTASSREHGERATRSASTGTCPRPGRPAAAVLCVPTPRWRG